MKPRAPKPVVLWLALLLLAVGWYLPMQAGQAQIPALPQESATTMVLTSQQSLDLPAGHLTLLQVNDSRCPTNTQCVWSGQVDVDLQLETPNQPTMTCRLSLVPGQPDRASRILRGYRLQLLAVTPQPQKDKTYALNDYQIRLAGEIAPDPLNFSAPSDLSSG